MDPRIAALRHKRGCLMRVNLVIIDKQTIRNPAPRSDDATNIMGEHNL